MARRLYIVGATLILAGSVGFLLITLWVTRIPAAGPNPTEAGLSPSVVLKNAHLIQMPGVVVPERKIVHAVDSNSPAHWDGNTFYLFNSYAHPYRLSGPDIAHLGNRVLALFNGLDDNLDIWIEATYKDPDGTLFGAYHYEPDTVCFSNGHLPTAPRIGWIMSKDNGKTWKDLGFVIQASPCAINCKTASPWDAGGTGDFVFNLDREKKYFYFYGTSYDPRFEEQGVWAARMRYSDRNDPSGKVMKWYKGGWNEPGLDGHLTPAFPAQRDYTHKDGEMFWGPSIHWNTYLNMYVMVLNHAIDTRLTGDGTYISFNGDLSNPEGWSKPRMILDRDQVHQVTRGGSASPNALGNGWYPEIIGTEKGESDKLCGRVGRLFVAGMSRSSIVFLKPGEKEN